MTTPLDVAVIDGRPAVSANPDRFIAGAAQRPSFDGLMDAFKPAVSSVKSLANNFRLKPDNIVDASPVAEVPEFVMPETAETGAVASESADKIGPFTPGQFLGLSAATTGLKTVGDLQGIRSQESAALDDMAKRFDIARTDLEANSRIQQDLRRATRTREIMRKVRALDSLGGGPVQRQIFDPSRSV